MGQLLARVGGSPAPALDEQLWARIEARIEEALTEIECVITIMLDRPASAGELRTARGVAQDLVHMLTRLGLFAAAEIARPLDDCFEPDATGIEAADLVHDLRVAIRGAAADVLMSRHNGARLLLVGPESPAADDLLWVAVTQAFMIDRLEGDELPDRVPDAVVLCVCDAGEARYRTLLRALAEQYANAPLVVVSGGPNPSRTRTRDGRGRFRSPAIDRITAALQSAAHADALVGIDEPPQRALEEVRAAILRRAHDDIVVVVGQDGLADDLRGAGLEARAESSTQAAYAALSTPGRRVGAVVVVDESARLTEAVPLARLLRARAATRATALLALGRRPAAEAVQRALHGGVDEVLPLEIEHDLLAAHVRRALRRRLEVAPPTAQAHGEPLPWASATLVLQRMLIHALRRRLRLALAVVVADPSVVSQADADTLGDLLNDEFRAEDVVARLDDSRVVVGLPGAGARVAVRRLEAIVKRLELPESACRAGVAEFPADGRAVDDLVVAALQAIERAESADGPFVVSADWRPDGERGPDVIVVDGDPVVGPVLADLVSRAGMRAIWIDAGDTAVEQLEQGGVAGLPRALLLDFDLPGIDGLEVLSRLGARGLVGQMSVVMISARLRDSDLRRAFALGAVDVLRKPISPVLLLHRLSQITER